MTETKRSTTHGDTDITHGPPDWVVCISDGGKAAMAFQTGALLALQQRGKLTHARILSASGSGCLVLNALVQAVLDLSEWGNWQREMKRATHGSWQGHKHDKERKDQKGNGNGTGTVTDEEDCAPLLVIDDGNELGAPSTRGGATTHVMEAFEQTMRQFCTTNFEHAIMSRRLRNVSRWFASDYSPELSAVLEDGFDLPFSMAHLQNTDQSAPVLLWSAEQLVQHRSALLPAERATPTSELMVLTSDEQPAQTTGALGMRIQTASRHTSLWSQTAAFCLGGELVDGWSARRAATRLDPLGYDAANTYYMRHRMNKVDDTKIPRGFILDGFSDSHMHNALSTSEQLAHGRRLSHVTSKQSATHEELHVVEDGTIRMSNYPQHAQLSVLQQATIANALANDVRLTALSRSTYDALVAWGKIAAGVAPSPKPLTVSST